MKKLLLFCLISLFAGLPVDARQKGYTILSPDGSICISLTVGEQLSYGVLVDGNTAVASTPIAMTLDNGSVWGADLRPSQVKRGSVDDSFATPYYIKAKVKDHYNWLRADFPGGFALELRAYDDGVAYRFRSTSEESLKIASEQAGACFPGDWECYAPYVRDQDGAEIIRFGRQFKTSFENLYTHTSLSKLDSTRLMFLPLVVATDRGVKLCFTESDLHSYPGMYLNNSDGTSALRAVFAPYPKRVRDGGHDDLQSLVEEYSEYIAQAAPRASFPWRTILIARQDRELLNNDMVMRLAEPSRLDDTSWIVPGKAAWEWWNDWGLFGVDFAAGINTPTYKHYIDFAADHGIEYLVIDDGWSKEKPNLMSGWNDKLDLPEIINYAKDKGVSIILWAGYRAFDRSMEESCQYYSELGVKGFKVDFMDRDDQLITEFLYRGAAMAAKYRLLIDYHGIYKPAGLQRTYPNVINFEGVHGQEQMKWSDASVDQVTYDVTMPFIRMNAGPVDYTQGAMLNAAQGHFVPRREEPMSQGTRCRQLAEYVVFFSPLTMLCDSPSNYEREAECTSFICGVPTVWDETVALDGGIGDQLVVARRKGEVWYVGGLTGREAHTSEVDLNFLGEGDFTVELFRDGANASKYGHDYVRELLPQGKSRILTVPMAPAGGFAVRITKN